MRISYAITVKDEFEEIQRVLPIIQARIRTCDEVVVLWDKASDCEKVNYIEEYLRSHSVDNSFRWYSDCFNGNFAEWKNKLKTLCTGDFIFQIDADEYPDECLIDNLPDIIAENNVDLIYVPRINIVKGLTSEHVHKWNWNVNENNWINFPDFQTRIYRNCSYISWENKVHERIIGFQSYAVLPRTSEWCLWHIKSIERQERQNAYYDTLIK